MKAIVPIPIIKSIPPKKLKASNFLADLTQGFISGLEFVTFFCTEGSVVLVIFLVVGLKEYSNEC